MLRHPHWIRAERAHHKITPVIIEGRKGGRPGIGEGRLRRGRRGEGEVAEIEVVVEEGRGGRRERDGVHGAGERACVGRRLEREGIMQCNPSMCWRQSAYFFYHIKFIC